MTQGFIRAAAGAEVALPPAAFLQASAEAEARMIALVTAAVGKAKRVADLFCGLGTFTFPLARRARADELRAQIEGRRALYESRRAYEGR